MTPGETTAKRNPEPPQRDDDIVAAILACGRDERAALRDLFELTGGPLYGLALAAAGQRAEADQAVVQTYLSAFNEAGLFERGRDEPLPWLLARLARHLPGFTGLAKGDAVRAVEPPAALREKLDIALGLERLARHIKPGVATQTRGRDPMPNAHDRSIERQLRFWRTTAATAGIAFVAATATATALGLRGSSVEPLAAPTPPVPEPTISAPATPNGAALPAPARRWALLLPAAAGRLWRVDEAAGMLAIAAVPPFAVSEPLGSGRRLVLWVMEGVGGTRALGQLEPHATTMLALPEDVAGETVTLAVSLEEAVGGPAAGPAGPILFSGRLGP